MRSTLLFVAVLLACTPVHGQTTGPVEAPVLHFWLAGVLPAAVAESGQTAVQKRRRPATPVPAMPASSQVGLQGPGAEPRREIAAANLLLHSPNAP